jgi:hypothetical protein
MVLFMGALIGGRQLHFQAVCKGLDVVKHARLVVLLGQHQGTRALALRLCRRVERGSRKADIFAFLVHIILCSDF